MTFKHLLNGVAIAAALATTAPVWAQNDPSSYSAAHPAPAPAAASATPPAHHAVRHARHRYAARKPARTADATAQLNREELARAQTEYQTAQNQSNRLKEDQAKQQEQLRNMYTMIRTTGYRP